MMMIFNSLMNCRITMAPPTAEASATETDLAAIEKLHAADIAAAKIHDIHTLITLLAEDCILLPPKQEPLCGREAIWNYMQAQLPESQKYEITEYIQHFEEIKIFGDWAYEWATFYGAYHPKSGGPDLYERSRLFRILRRQQDGTWQVARAIWHELPYQFQ